MSLEISVTVDVATGFGAVALLHVPHNMQYITAEWY